MYDIDFFQKVDGLKRRIVAGEFSKGDAAQVSADLEELRNPYPNVFNMETTNYCNMKCVMCPRTTMMTRKNIWIEDGAFTKVLDQIKPHDQNDLEEFWKFVGDTYSITEATRDENAFYFKVVARCLILHGYGEPLLDKKIAEHVQECTKRNIPTYLSCVPANLTVEKAEALMQAGLGVLKFSIDALDDELQKQIRGKQNNFEKAFKTILDVIDLKAAKGYKTLLVPTMIALKEDEESRKMQEDFLKLWVGKDVFAYVKSQDNRWYFEEDEELENRSHYETQYCEYPWTSMTVMANGKVVPCTQDVNVEMVLGDVNEQTLEEIWNGEPFKQLRDWHVTGNFPEGFKCDGRCDQKKVANYLEGTVLRGDI